MDRQAVAEARREEALLSDKLFPMSFREAAGLENVVTILGTRMHLLCFRKAAGNPSDPVEQTLLDMLALARMRLGRVHAAAEKSVGPEAARVYLSAGNRLMGETCKTVLTLAAYRKSQRRHRQPPKKKSDGEVGSNGEGI
jgi:hypothetical protein